MPLTATLEVAANAYAAFAAYYDRYTDHPDYASWILGVEQTARAHGLHGRRLLDLGCGTGKSLLPHLERGYEVTGCDAVPEMLACARRKCGDRARLVHADVAALPQLGAFDFVTCLNDAANHLLEAAQLDAFLRGAAANLRPGGVLVFDANTLLTFRTIYATTATREPDDGALFVWRGHAATDFADGGLARGTLDAFLDDGDGRWTRSTTTHVARHHRLAGVRAAISRAGLELLAELGQYEDGSRDASADETVHHKALYVARRSPTA